MRKNGYACDLEEHELHIRCIAAPIWDHAGEVNASLSITAPAVRMAVTRLRQLAPLIQTAGLQISRELGYPSGGYHPPLRETDGGEAATCETSVNSAGRLLSRFRGQCWRWQAVRHYSSPSSSPAWRLERETTLPRAPIHARSMSVPRICWFNHLPRIGFPTTETIQAAATAVFPKSTLAISRDCVRSGCFMQATRDGLRSLRWWSME